MYSIQACRPVNFSLLFTCTILFVSRICLVPSGRARPRLKLSNDFHSSARSSKVFLPLFLDVHDVITKMLSSTKRDGLPMSFHISHFGLLHKKNLPLFLDVHDVQQNRKMLPVTKRDGLSLSRVLSFHISHFGLLHDKKSFPTVNSAPSLVPLFLFKVM